MTLKTLVICRIVVGCLCIAAVFTPAVGAHFDFDLPPLHGAIFDCHSCVRETYFSTLLQADKGGPCGICKIGDVNVDFITFTETLLLGRDPLIPVFGAKPAIPFQETPYLLVSGSTVMGSSMIIKGPLNPLVTALLVPWKSDMKDFWARARLARWPEQQQKARGDATDDTVRGIEQLHEQAFYKDTVARFYLTLSLPPEKPGAYYYRATAKLALGDAESTLRNVEQAQHLYRTAIQDYTQAISGTLRNTNVYAFRSYAKFRLGLLASAMGNVEQAECHYHAAIADCNQAMALYQEDEDALKAALAVYTEVSDVMRDYPGAIKFRERYAFAYHLRGLGKQALGQHTEAEVDFRKAKVLELVPESGGPLAPTLGRRTW